MSTPENSPTATNGNLPVGNRDRLLVKGLDFAVERLSGLSDNLALRRTPGEFAGDVADSAAEAGRQVAGKIGEKVMLATEATKGIARNAFWGANGAIEGIRDRQNQGKESIQSFFADKKTAAQERKATRIENRQERQTQRAIIRQGHKDAIAASRQRRAEARQIRSQERRAKWEPRKETLKAVGGAVLLAPAVVALGGANLIGRAGKGVAKGGRAVAEGGRNKATKIAELGAKGKEAVRNDLSQRRVSAQARRDQRVASRAARADQRSEQRRIRLESQKAQTERVRQAQEARRQARQEHIEARRQARHEKWSGRKDELKTAGRAVTGAAARKKAQASSAGRSAATRSADAAKGAAYKTFWNANGIIGDVRERRDQSAASIRNRLAENRANSRRRKNNRLINGLVRKSDRAFEKSVNQAHTAALHDDRLYDLQRGR
jgi:hypothetical protein